MVSRLRVWERTWVTANGGVQDVSTGSTVASDLEPDSARLIAAAPAMARTLMVLAGMGADPYCNGCGDTRTRAHARDCSLMQLLFEAGVGDLKQADVSSVLRVVK